jgi:hypothetical protein
VQAKGAKENKKCRAFHYALLAPFCGKIRFSKVRANMSSFMEKYHKVIA